jgi:OmpA-OmpF porin, OOP family
MKIQILVIILIAAQLQSQTLRESIFSEIEQLKSELTTKNSYRLSQINSEKANEHHREAEDLFRANENMADVRKEVKAAKSFYRNALARIEDAEQKLSFMIKARRDAEKVNAKNYQKSRWDKAIELFEDAAKELEKGDRKDAEEVAGEAEQIFRQLELNAIKAIYFTETINLIKKAENDDVDDNAPNTLKKAKKLIKEAETVMNQNRYDTDLPRSLAQQANYEVRHAIYLDKVLRLFDDKNTSNEDMLLYFEEPVKQIASTLDFVSEFDKGHSKVADQIIEKVKTLQDEGRKLAETVSQQVEQIQVMEARIKEMDEKLGGIAQEKSKLQKMMERQAEIRERFKAIGSMFSRENAIVLRDGNDIIIRLIGLTFKSGKSNLETEHYALLKDVQEALQIFDRSNIVITGHTDSYGGDQTNMTLSENRALAIKEYLISNMTIKVERLESLGYGESKPIANNETAEGRKRNRRIDIVIKPIVEELE